MDATGNGTSTGTTSDQNGTFTLQNVPSDASIQISYVGYEPETIPVSELKNNKNETISLNLKPILSDLVEVTEKRINNTLTRQYSPTTTEQESTKRITTRNQAPINEDLPPPTESEPQPTLSEEDQKAKIAELKDNLDNAKQKEQSTENKLLSGASMGAMGIAGMQTLSALSEQRADQQAEQDMTAYLATFRCDFGQGKFIKGGQTNVELPGAGQLSTLYNEYMNLAEDLKTRKESLGLAQGIESEVIIDTSVINLYDDVGTGRNGTFTSLAKALSDSTSADAAEWAEQKEKTSQQIKNGIITMVTTAVASTATNKLINDSSSDNDDDKTSDKDKTSKEDKETQNKTTTTR